jgi:hypothetical protein
MGILPVQASSLPHKSNQLAILDAKAQKLIIFCSMRSPIAWLESEFNAAITARQYH